VAGDVTASPPISELGFDPLLAMPSEAAFAAHFTRRAAPIKAVLLNQKIAAGVGNWIADEVLYHAAIHPEQPAGSLTSAQLCRVRGALSMVVETACAAGADHALFPPEWLFHHRWGKVAGKVAGKAISFITVGGRTTAFVPLVQKKTNVSPPAGEVAAAVKKAGGASGARAEVRSQGASRGRKRAAKVALEETVEPETAEAPVSVTATGGARKRKVVKKALSAKQVAAKKSPPGAAKKAPAAKTAPTAVKKAPLATKKAPAVKRAPAAKKELAAKTALSAKLAPPAEKAPLAKRAPPAKRASPAERAPPAKRARK
jgi:formamidopyrimidine-DNA glycosylase